MPGESGCVAALYDCRSKQEYIYRTNRIKEISGGSALLAKVYKMFFAKAAEKDIKIKSDWSSGNVFSVEGFLKSGFDGEVIYEGGGNLFMIYRDKDTYIRANNIFSKMLLDETYSVSLAASCTEVTDNFIDDRRRLYEQNGIIKAAGTVSVPCAVLPITQVDGVTYMPIVEKTVIDKKPVSLSRESVLKRRAFEAAEQKGEKFLDDIIGESKGTESLLAVIYVDGNAMGKKVKSCTEGKSGYTECAKALRELSENTNRTFVERPLEAIEKMLGEKFGKGMGRWRTVIAGGDEITIICRAGAALDIAETYFNTLEEENRTLAEDKKNYACMGIAIAHSHAPFADVYKIAEQCCESGKKKSRKKNSAVNYVDFHFCRAGITNDLDDIRKSGDGGYTARPYEFSEEFEEFARFGKKLKIIGRSNIKALASAIMKGDSYYVFEAERIKSRYPKFGIDSGSEKQKKLIFDIANVYDLWFADKEEAE
ncbi:MAG: hypothetical protein NC120_03735 [Ruminococcus sp.]|nr:hypothetical protein [Ruminococcus sp.]